MLTLRYNAAKSWANYACAVAAGVVIVLVLGSLWDRSALVGGFSGLVAVTVMLLIGVVKRTSHKDPIVTVDGHGITIGLPKFGVIPWSAIRHTEIKGVPWVTGVRLVIDYEGTAPKLGWMDKLNWGVQSKQKGTMARVSVGFMDMTDQPISTLKSAVDQAIPAVKA